MVSQGNVSPPPIWLNGPTTKHTFYGCVKIWFWKRVLFCWADIDALVNGNQQAAAFVPR